MNSRGQLALAIGAGYLLGRSRKMKAALMLGAAGATGSYPGSPLQLVQRGAKALASSPEVAQLGDSIRGELMSAAKQAAVTAASGRLESLNDRLSGVEGTVDDVSDTVDDVADTGVDTATGALNGLAGKPAKGRRRKPDADDEADADIEASSNGANAPRKPVRRRRSTTESSEKTEEKRSTPRRTRASSASTSTRGKSAPVRRTRSDR